MQNVFQGRSIGMLKRYHDIPCPNIKDETKPFSLLIRKPRKNLVFDRWRNVSFTPQVLAPGMILFKKYLTLIGQVYFSPFNFFYCAHKEVPGWTTFLI